MSDNTAKEEIKRGLVAYLPEEIAEAIVEGIDIDALIEGGELGDSVDYEHFGRVLGGTLGGQLGGVAGKKVGSEDTGKKVGSIAGQKAVRLLIKYGDTEMITNQLEKLPNSERLSHFAETVKNTISGVSIPWFGSETKPEDGTNLPIRRKSENNANWWRKFGGSNKEESD